MYISVKKDVGAKMLHSIFFQINFRKGIHNLKDIQGQILFRKCM